MAEPGTSRAVLPCVAFAMRSLALIQHLLLATAAG
jgi:hypothetical protein